MITDPKFLAAVKRTLRNEGGYVDNVIETTNFGISLKFLRTCQPGATADDIRAMTAEAATALYYTYFWQAHRLGEIADARLAGRAFDLTVNMGAGGITAAGKPVWGGVTLLQLATRDISVDGLLGPVTLAAINAQDPARLYPRYVAAADLRYRAIAQAPGKALYLDGWLSRLHDEDA